MQHLTHLASGISDPHTSFFSAHHATGFTLLEMLLVVGILSALAMSALGFVGNRDQQTRWELTQKRLQEIRQASTGWDNEDFVPYGFVADNGLLPATIDALLATPPAGWENNGLKTPVFDATPQHESGLDDGTDSTSISQASAQLHKGWRNAYLLSPAGAGGKFQDGWGNAGNAPDHGWLVDSSSAGRLSVSSLGSDGISGGSDYAADMSMAIEPAHWSSAIGNLKVKVINGSGTDLGAATTQRRRISLLVFENGNAGRWKRYTSELPCLDGNGDMQVAGMACNNSAIVSFPSAGCDNSSVCAYTRARIPLGQHLLVVVNDPDGNAHTPDDALYPDATTTLLTPLRCRASGCPQETVILR